MSYKRWRCPLFCVVQPALAAATLLCLALPSLPVPASPPNQPPELSPIGDQTINEGSLLVFNASATDPDIPTQTLTFTLEAGAPEGAAISASGLFTWTPSELEGPGTYTLRVIVADSGSPSLTATQAFNVTVQEINLAPALGGVIDRTVNEGELLTFTASATDPDLPAQPLTFTLGGSPPAGASIDAVTGVFTWTPSELQGPGTYFISIFVTDNGIPTQNDARGFLVTVQEVNRPPELPALSDLAVNEGSFIGFSALPTDPDIPAQSVTVTLGPGAPAGAAITSGGFFTWSSGEAQGPSTNRIAIIATDNGTPSLTATQFFTAIILEVNQAPALDFVADQTVLEGQALAFTATATDPDLPAQSLAFTLGAGAPTGASVDPATGAFTWTPTEAQGPGTYVLSVVVTDNSTLPQSTSRSFTISVQESNLPPQLAALDDRVVAEGSLLVFNLAATDPDIPTQTLAFTLGPGAPEGATVGSNGLFTWTPAASQGPSTNRITVIVADNGTPSLTATQMFTAIVTDLNGAPVLAVIADQTIDEGQLLTFTTSATDPDQPGQTLTFSLGAGAPPGAAIDASTGVFTWTPAEAQGPGTNTIGVTVADSGTPPLTASRSFTVVVQEINVPPALAVIDDRAINSGALMTFNASATDPDIPAQTLTFMLGPGAPAGAAISAGGLFTWTPAGAQSPSTNRIAVIVGDNGAPSLAATQHFNAIVTDLNRAPSLAAIPDQTASEGELLTFTASATDPDQPLQTLAFSLGAGAPDGAAIDASSGVFTWTPSELHGPATNVITVIVTDNGAPALSVSRGVLVVVNEVNRPPEMDPIADQIANVGGFLVFGVPFRDPDIPAQTVVLSLGSGAPEGVAISSGGLFTWTPTPGQAATTNTIAVIASDNGVPSLTATQRFQVIVQGINHAPTLAAIPEQTVNEGVLLTFPASATDPEQPLQTLTFTLGAGAPEGAAIDPGTGVFTWTPSELHGPGTNVITIIVTDNGIPAIGTSRGVTVMVNEVNRPPEIDPIADQVANVGGFLVFGVPFRDPDIPAQAVVAILGPGAPEGAAISPGGLFTWTPSAAQSGTTNTIAVIASDNGVPSLTATQRFTIIVQGVNGAPSLAPIADQSVNEGDPVAFTASASDPDQPLQTLTFTLGAGAPVGAAIDPASGVFNWTPSETQGPGTNTITVAVTDSGAPPMTASRSFTVIVNEVNQAPVITPINDQAINSGALMIFNVPASDPDIPIQTLTFNLGPDAPAGAAISAGGVFTWTPTLAQSPSTNVIAVIATDNGSPSLSATQWFTAIVTDLNRAPSLTAIPDQAVNEGALLTFTASATDSDQPAQTLTFSLGAGAPDGAAIDSNTGVFTWTPSELQGPATNIVTVIVTDNGIPSLSSAQGVTIAVSEINRPPEIDPVADQVANVGGLLVFGVPFRDPDIPIQTLVATLGPGAPAGAAISSGGLFTWTPTPGQAATTNTIAVIASDNGVPSLTATQRFQVIVQGINHAPTLAAIPEQTVNEGVLLTFTASATDPEQPLQTLAFTLGAGAPEGAAIDPSTGVFTWTPSEFDGPATNILTVIVTDNGTPALSASRGVTVVINEVNRPPEIDPIPDQIANVGGFLVFGIPFRDPDIPAQLVVVTLGPGAPEGAALSPGGLFTWTPTPAQASTTNVISVIATDSAVPSLTATQRFTLIVQGINHAPTLDLIPDQTVNEGQLLTFTAHATDLEQPLQTLTFSLGAGAPDGAAIDPNTGVFAWTPAEVHGPATNVITVIVADNGTPALSAARSINVAVNEVNRPPELDPISDKVASVGSFLVFGVTFRDPDIPFQVLTASLGSGAPDGAAISTGGLFTWTPAAGQASSVNPIDVIISDNAVPSLTTTQRFTVTVGGFNRPPSLEAIPDQTANEGQPLTFTINASDPDQPFQSLTYTLGPGAPPGASLDPATGVFTWTPTEFQGPETNLLSVVVTDNGVPPMAVFGNVRIVVNEVNQPPFFLPETNLIVNVGSPLIFTVEADDLDIPLTLLTYSLAPGAPGGASITPRGEFSWRPAAGQGPSNYFVKVVVSDGGVPVLRATNVIEINVIVGAPQTPPVLHDPSWSLDNVFTATIDMIAGRRYTLEGSDSANPPNWRGIEAFQGRGAVDTMTDRNATNRTRMYRARVE
jgi:methyl coenzyme M reductase subunit C